MSGKACGSPLLPALAALLALELSCSGPQARGGAPAQADQVVIISIDGLRPDAIEEAPAENLKRLTARGAHCPRAETVRPSATLPAHASMLTGLDFPRHGVVWNNYRPGRILSATVFSICARANLPTAMLFTKDKFLYLVDRNSIAWAYGPEAPATIPPPQDLTDPEFLAGEDERARQRELAAARMRPAPPDPRWSAGTLCRLLEEEWPQGGYALTFIHFGEPDGAGHAARWMSAEYLRAVREVDQAVGRVLQAIMRAGRSERTVLIVTSDHGGSERDHFDWRRPDKPENVHIPWICAGAGVKEGLTIERAIRIYDTMPTALALLGLPFPDGIDGEPVREVLRQAIPLDGYEVRSR